MTDEHNKAVERTTPITLSDLQSLLEQLGAARQQIAQLLEDTGCKDLADVADMAKVGQSLIERIHDLSKSPGPFQTWRPADSPTEIVFDLVNHYEDQLAAQPTAPPGGRKGVERQVALAAELTERQRENPEWLWYNHKTRVLGFGNWQKESAQAPYVRADLANTPGPPIKWTTETTQALEAIGRRLDGEYQAMSPCELRTWRGREVEAIKAVLASVPAQSTAPHDAAMCIAEQAAARAARASADGAE